ncbi:MAG: hypothetical protein QW512_02130 [Thermofilaceae archaeon]
MCRSMIYDPSTAEYVCLETGEVFGDRIVDLPSMRDLHHYSYSDIKLRLRRRRKLRRRRLVREVYRLGAALELGEQTIRQAVALSQRKLPDPRSVRLTALALLYIADRLLHGTPSTLFCRKLLKKLQMRIECRKFTALCRSIAAELNIKLDAVEVDCTSTILRTASLITDNDYLKAEIVKRAKALYSKLKQYYTGSRYYIAIACTVQAARTLGVEVALERICESLNANCESVRRVFRWMRKHSQLL